MWIGGQVLVADLMPALPGVDGLAAIAGRRFQLIAWPAFRTLIVTGALNTRKAGITWSDVVSTPTGKTLLVKLGFVALSGAAAALHAFPPAPRSVLITVGTRREHQRWSLCLHRSTASSSRNSELNDAPHCAQPHQAVLAVRRHATASLVKSHVAIVVVSAATTRSRVGRSSRHMAP